MQREFIALADGDGATACALATVHGRAKLMRATSGASCRRTVASLKDFFPVAVKLGMHNATIGKVIVSGAVALVYDDQITSSQGTLEASSNPARHPPSSCWTTPEPGG